MMTPAAEEVVVDTNQVKTSGPSNNQWHALVYIPTHRDAAAAIRSVGREVESVTVNDSSCFVTIILLDVSGSEIQTRHRDVLYQLKFTRKESVRVVHLDDSAQNTLCQLVIAGKSGPEKLRRLLLPDQPSYGRGPNLAVLLATAIRADSLHRRDSDVTSDPIRVDHPLDQELLVLRTVLEKLSIERLPAQLRRSHASMVGTGMFGSPTIDRQTLFDVGSDLVFELQALGRPGVDRAAVAKEAIDYLLVEPQLKESFQYLDYDVDARIEMGCCAMRVDLGKQIPEMPTGILGCDYMTKDWAWKSGSGLVYHSTKAVHTFDRSRQEDIDESAWVDYTIRDIQYLQVGRIWARHGDHVASNVDLFLDSKGTLDTNEYAASFEDALDAGIEDISEIRYGARRVYEQAYARSSTSSSHHRRLALLIDQISDELDARTIQALRDYIALVRAWPGLISSAYQLGPQILDFSESERFLDRNLHDR